MSTDKEGCDDCCVVVLLRRKEARKGAKDSWIVYINTYEYLIYKILAYLLQRTQTTPLFGN